MARKRKLRKGVSILLDIILAAALLTAAFSGYKLYQGLHTYHTAQKAYDDIRDTVIVKPVQSDDSPSGMKQIDWDSLHEISPDVIAWIEMEDSSIDYPVVQGADNVWYLKHLIDGSYNDAGTVFMDASCSKDFTGINTVLYAHHMLNEPLMFAEIENFEDQGYYESHRRILIHTPDAEYEMYPVAGMVTTGTSEYIRLSFAGDEDYLSYIDWFVSRSTFISQETITAGDQMMMLSTCSYDVTDGRYVLIGKLVKL